MNKKLVKYKNIFFDFDGVLFDTREGILECLLYTINKVKREDVKTKIDEKLIGPSVGDIFKKLFPNKDDKFFKKCIKIFRKEYRNKGVFMVKPMKDLKKMLEELRKENKRLIIISNKPRIFIKKILKEFNVLNYFDCIIGISIGQTESNKITALKKTIKKLRIKKEESIMVGDRADDIIAAKENGIPSLGVTYGFGSLEELKSFGADFICNSSKELRKILIT